MEKEEREENEMTFHELETCSELIVINWANWEAWKTSKPSIDIQHEPYLKKFPHHLGYTSLEKDLQPPLIITSNLEASQEEQVLVEEEEMEDSVDVQHNYKHECIREDLLELYCP